MQEFQLFIYCDAGKDERPDVRKRQSPDQLPLSESVADHISGKRSDLAEPCSTNCSVKIYRLKGFNNLLRNCQLSVVRCLGSTYKRLKQYYALPLYWLMEINLFCIALKLLALKMFQDASFLMLRKLITRLQRRLKVTSFSDLPMLFYKTKFWNLFNDLGVRYMVYAVTIPEGCQL